MNLRTALPYVALICLLAAVVPAQEDAAPVDSNDPGEVADASTEAATVDQAPVRHVVLLKFSPEATAEDIKKIETAFAALEEKIDQVQDLEWGTDSSPEGLAKGFTHCLFLTFASEADRDAYLPHPQHKAFVEIVKPHLEEALVIDYQPK